MPTSTLRASTALLALAVSLPLGAAAATKPFTGPAGWEHTVGLAATPQNPRASETWRKSDGQLVSYLADAGTVYDDTVALVKKNISDNAFKTSTDTDRKCDGRRAHELEMTFGTSVVHQVIVDDAPGVTKLTYTRNQGLPMDPDVTGRDQRVLRTFHVARSATKLPQKRTAIRRHIAGPQCRM